ncbi:conserved hypothetical protein [Cellulomonas flavigena DSM 20109]|uniref:MucB/RseB N-terminal domain-containing protein n=1 Tax=Cellulomonas flavigena (strain ATCC 482 / DSM 20109 / BCRC 11376 / JCM 18109 / NBRC 3775 / NCIMB 8073 / NRS 134) TaxID=446466 RepID=D5UBU8_CELFN|nr:hypothetical protein [Cellulomonas flavigena]ADG74193.1 conserved hypothetical protein [Cellulomonas flavigena DSM 20109]
MDTAPVSPTRTRARAAWAVPAAAVVAVAAAFAAPPLLASARSASLPLLTAEELLERVLDAEPPALSGTVVHTARLGLPDLSLTQVAGADPVSLLGGSTTLRVWSDGGQRSRVSLLGTASEYSVVTDGAQAWTYSSSDDEVVHYAPSPQDAQRVEELAQASPPADLPTPDELGRDALERAREHATVGVDAATTVAGRDAYQVVVTPRSDTTLVGRVVVAVDAATWSPLRVQVWSSDDAATPALELGFTDVTFADPGDAVLTFSAPPGASVREVVVPLPTEEDLAERATDASWPTDADDAELPEGVQVTGEGWDTVLELSGVDAAALVAGDPAAVAGMPGVDKQFAGEGAQGLYEQFAPEGDGPPMDLDTASLYDQLTTPVEGGRALTSSLLSVLVLDDGRVLVGSVPVDVLRATADA